MNSTYASFVESGIVLIDSELFVKKKPCRVTLIRFVNCGSSVPMDLQNPSICRIQSFNDDLDAFMVLPKTILAGTEIVSPGPITQCPMLATTTSLGCKFSSYTGIALSMPKLSRLLQVSLHILGMVGRASNRGTFPPSTISNPYSGSFLRNLVNVFDMFLIDKLFLDKAKFEKHLFLLCIIRSNWAASVPVTRMENPVVLAVC